jgi:hypothetical protein
MRGYRLNASRSQYPLPESTTKVTMTRKQLAVWLVYSTVLGVLLGSPLVPRLAWAAPTATIVVDVGSDENVCSGFLTLRCAINYANANAGTWIRLSSR